MKNRTSLLFVTGLIFLAAIGVIGTFVSNPTGFIQNIVILIIVGFIVYFIVRRFYKASPEKREQQAFRKAAKRSKRRTKHKDIKKHPQSTGSLSTLKRGNNKKKSTSHLTVIEGKKGKKKNRASF